MKKNAFPAKVLLFGEHTILRGSHGLALPLRTHHSAWRYGGTPVQQAGLLPLQAHLRDQFPTAFDHEQLARDLAAGRYLASTIPTGYGLGSSGAVCVAVFDGYATPTGRQLLSDMGAKAFFARMEGCFHGTSSGVDPLIIYADAAIRLLPGGSYQAMPLPMPTGGWQFFLLDTRHPRSTGPLVAYFVARYDTDAEFRQRTDAGWSAPTDAAIAALLRGDMEAVWANFGAISAFQLNELPPMVLPEVHLSWADGLAGGTYLLKLCGAGGGGFYLGLTPDWPAAQAALAGHTLLPLVW